MPGPKTNEREGTRAVLRHSHVAPNKVREVLNLIRNRTVAEAEDILRFSERDVAFTVGKLLASAVANAEHNDGLDPEELFISACYADEGATIKRWRPRARGRATRIRKRTSHITVIVSRMPQVQIDRIRARRQAEQLAQRARRVAGARANEGDTRSRAERRRRGAAAEHDHDHEGHDHEGHDHDHDEADETAADDAVVEEGAVEEAPVDEAVTDEVETEAPVVEEAEALEATPAVEDDAVAEVAEDAPASEAVEEEVPAEAEAADEAPVEAEAVETEEKDK
jgi:large subunit ribosomal protein L22